MYKWAIIFKVYFVLILTVDKEMFISEQVQASLELTRLGYFYIIAILCNVDGSLLIT